MTALVMREATPQHAKASQQAAARGAQSLIISREEVRSEERPAASNPRPPLITPKNRRAGEPSCKIIVQKLFRLCRQWDRIFAELDRHPEDGNLKINPQVGRAAVQMAGEPARQQAACATDPAANRSPMAWSLGLALLAFAIRAPGLFAGFVFDDAFGMQQRSGADWSQLGAFFTSDRSAFYGSNFYRPVLNVFWEVVYAIGGAHPLAWHGASILLHVACALLVFQLALLVIEDVFAAWLAAALFAVHPAHVEAVSWASAIAEPLWTLFLLLSVLAFLRWLERGGVRWWAASFIAGAAGIFTKETAIVLPVVLLATALALFCPSNPNAGLPGAPRSRNRRAFPVLAATLPFFAIAALFLAVRQSVLHSFSHSLTVATSAQMVLTWPAALLFYLRHMFWPSVVVPFYPLQIVKSWHSEEFLLPLAELIVALAALGFLLWRAAGPRRALVCTAWTFVPLAPALYLKALAPFELVHDRFLYAPLVGFCMATAMVLQWAAARIEAYSQSRAQAVSVRRVMAIAAIALIPLYGIESMSQMLWWQNNKTLFARALTVTPENPKALANLAGVYMAEHREAEAAPLLQRALEIAPQDSIVLYGMARLAWLQGEDKAAEQFMIGALRTTSRYDMWLQFAAIELRLNKLDIAEAAARQAAQMNPNGQGVHAAMGTILLARGERQTAVREFEQELRNFPQSEIARAGLARIHGASPR